MKIEIYPPLFIHEIGQRDNQEDALWPLQATADDRLFVLCDGMGGHEKGEVASQTVCLAIGKWFAERTNPNEPFSKDQLREALEYAYNELDKYADDSFRQMGTTLTFIFIGRNGVTAAHIGDSRIYHIRPSEGVLYQSRDHSLVFDLFQAGEITYEEMATYPRKNLITRAMQPGEDNRVRPDIVHITSVEKDDWFVLCSDGMLEQMSNDELVSILTSKTSGEEKRQKLIEATKGNQDNHTAWLIHIRSVEYEEADRELVNEELTSRCNALKILPRPNNNDNLQIADEDDVVVVSRPKPSKKKRPLQQMVFTTLAFLFALMIIWFIFLRNTEKETAPKEEPLMQLPVKPSNKKDNTKDSINKDSTRKKKNESTGNQQPVNAPRRNDTQRHLQN